MLLLALSPLWWAKPAAAGDKQTPLQVVPSVDLKRYAGKWYEIARLPNWFEKACTANTAATYTLQPDGKIQVLNECNKADGRLKIAKGTAKVADSKGPNTKLKVTFFWPFSGDYWIIDLDPNYQWVVVGEPSRDYLWILARNPRLDGALYQQILERVKKHGYTPDKLIESPQR